MRGRNSARLAASFRLSIPKAVRNERGWEAGQVFILSPKGKGLLLQPAPTLQQLAGSARDARPDGYRDKDDRT